LIGPQLRARPLGDSAVTISFGAERSEEVLRRVHAASHSLRTANIPHVQDVVPAYLALTVFYDSLRTSYHEIAEQLLDTCVAGSLLCFIQIGWHCDEEASARVFELMRNLITRIKRIDRRNNTSRQSDPMKGDSVLRNVRTQDPEDFAL